MRARFLVLLFFCSLPFMATAQTSAVGDSGSSRITTLVGAGNSFGGIGVLADIRPFARGPLSLMLSVGSTKAFFDVQHFSAPWLDESVASVAAAVGVRANVGHGRHQGFLELAYLPVDDDVVELSAERFRSQMLYGLGLQLGYRARVTRTISVNVLGGAGYALNRGVVASRWKPVFGFGFGYAWR
jgi:hypothetical protein